MTRLVNDPEPLGSAFHHLGSTFITYLAKEGYVLGSIGYLFACTFYTWLLLNCVFMDGSWVGK